MTGKSEKVNVRLYPLLKSSFVASRDSKNKSPITIKKSARDLRFCALTLKQKSVE